MKNRLKRQATFLISFGKTGELSAICAGGLLDVMIVFLTINKPFSNERRCSSVDNYAVLSETRLRLIPAVISIVVDVSWANDW